MTWQVVVAFIIVLVVGGIIFGIIGYRKGAKDEYSYRNIYYYNI